MSNNAFFRPLLACTLSFFVCRSSTPFRHSLFMFRCCALPSWTQAVSFAPSGGLDASAAAARQAAPSQVGPAPVAAPPAGHATSTSASSTPTCSDSGIVCRRADTNTTTSTLTATTHANATVAARGERRPAGCWWRWWCALAGGRAAGLQLCAPRGGHPARARPLGRLAATAGERFLISDGHRHPRENAALHERKRKPPHRTYKNLLTL